MTTLIKNALAIVEHVNSEELFKTDNNSILIENNVIVKIGHDLQVTCR